MKQCSFIIICICFCAALFAQPQTTTDKKYILVIHGGAGTILKSRMTPEKEGAYRQGLQNALNAGSKILQQGGSAIDAVEATVKILEDDSLFNAGKGAVFTSEGRNELDASIMDGKTLKAGAVAGVSNIKNPIAAARAVMDKSEHVMMAGRGAEIFAAKNGCAVVDPSYFFTTQRWNDLQEAKKEDSLKTLHEDSSKAYLKQPDNYDYKYGTVGAVAMDTYGNLAAATSTGGMTNKKFGRVGDAPVIGAGTYADNNSCAVSCTGWGEYFIRLSMAKSVSDRMELAHMNLKDAANEMIMKNLPALGGDGGLIAVDKAGNFTMSFNTDGMYRGYVKSNGETAIEIYKD
jgi:beta-aspartyl-peptidase (threonine type)